MMDAMDRFGQELVLAGRRRHPRRRLLSALRHTFRTDIVATPRIRASACRAVALALVLATSAITLAATGVILTGSPVGAAHLRSPPPAMASRWRAARGCYPCEQQTRPAACHGECGHPHHARPDLRADRPRLRRPARTARRRRRVPRRRALPPAAHGRAPRPPGERDGMDGRNLLEPGRHLRGDSVGLELNAATGPGPGAGVPADRREISFGLLGVHAVSITYREGSMTRTKPVLPGFGAYLIVQRYTSGRPLGSVSETDGRDEPGNYSGPAGPNGALTAITYDYAGRSCVDRGDLRMASCGLSEVPPPARLRCPSCMSRCTHLEIHDHAITSAQSSFRAPYPVTNADANYSVTAPCAVAARPGKLQR